MPKNSLLDLLNELRGTFKDVHKEIFLSIDKAWEEEMKLQDKNIRRFYKKHKEK